MATGTDYSTLLKMTAVPKPPKVKRGKVAESKAVTIVNTKNITERMRSDGSPSYLVNLRLQKDGAPWVYRETFSTLVEAVVARDKARAAHRAGEAIVAVKIDAPFHIDVRLKQTVADIIALRLEQGKATGRSAKQVLRYISNSCFGSLSAADLSARDIRDLADFLNNGQRKPQTIASYMTPLVYALKWAHNREHDVPLSKIQQAMATLWED